MVNRNVHFPVSYREMDVGCNRVTFVILKLPPPFILIRYQWTKLVTIQISIDREYIERPKVALEPCIEQDTHPHPVTSSGKVAPGPDPRIRQRIQIGMFRPIRVDHNNCLQVTIKTHSFIIKLVQSFYVRETDVFKCVWQYRTISLFHLECERIQFP